MVTMTSNFSSIDRNEVLAKLLSVLEDVIHAFLKQNTVDKVLAHCVKHINDAVEQTDLVKQSFFTVFVTMLFVVCLTIMI